LASEPVASKTGGGALEWMVFAGGIVIGVVTLSTLLLFSFQSLWRRIKRLRLGGQQAGGVDPSHKPATDTAFASINTDSTEIEVRSGRTSMMTAPLLRHDVAASGE